MARKSLYYSAIKKVCEEKSVPVRLVEKSAGLSNGSISKWDEHDPSTKNLKKVIDVLSISYADLFEKEMEAYSESKFNYDSCVKNICSDIDKLTSELLLIKEFLQKEAERCTNSD